MFSLWAYSMLSRDLLTFGELIEELRLETLYRRCGIPSRFS